MCCDERNEPLRGIDTFVGGDARETRATSARRETTPERTRVFVRPGGKKIARSCGSALSRRAPRSSSVEKTTVRARGRGTSSSARDGLPRQPRRPREAVQGCEEALHDLRTGSSRVGRGDGDGGGPILRRRCVVDERADVRRARSPKAAPRDATRLTARTPTRPRSQPPPRPRRPRRTTRSRTPRASAWLGRSRTPSARATPRAPWSSCGTGRTTGARR